MSTAESDNFNTPEAIAVLAIITAFKIVPVFVAQHERERDDWDRAPFFRPISCIFTTVTFLMYTWHCVLHHLIEKSIPVIGIILLLFGGILLFWEHPMLYFAPTCLAAIGLRKGFWWILLINCFTGGIYLIWYAGLLLISITIASPDSSVVTPSVTAKEASTADRISKLSKGL